MGNFVREQASFNLKMNTKFCSSFGWKVFASRRNIDNNNNNNSTIEIQSKSQLQANQAINMFTGERGWDEEVLMIDLWRKGISVSFTCFQRERKAGKHLLVCCNHILKPIERL